MTPATPLPAAPPPARSSQDQASRLRAYMNALAPAPAGPPVPQLVRPFPLVAITSGKGGVGKTALAVNLAIDLARLGLSATLFDADLGMANADVLCGMNPPRRLEHALSQGGTPDDLARALGDITLEAPGGFRLVPGSVGLRHLTTLGAIERHAILQALVSQPKPADVCLIDTGAGMGPSVVGFAEACDLALVVTTPEPTALADAYAMIKCLAPRLAQPGQVPRLALVVNQVRDEREGGEVHGRLAAVSRRFLGFELPMVGMVHADEAWKNAVRARRPMLLDASGSSRGAREVRLLAQALARRLRIDPPGGARRLPWWRRAFTRGPGAP